MEPDPLVEWNRLNRENAEHALISVMFTNVVARAPQADTFSTWLLAGTGASATLMITNIQGMLTAFSGHGFKVTLLMLVLSAVFGLLAKYVFVFFQYGGDSQSKLIEQIKPILDTHSEQQAKIRESAKLRGVTLDTDIRMDVVLTEFAKPLPHWSRWLVMRYINKHKENRQIAHLLPVRFFHWQIGLSFFQGLTFLIFILCAVFYARAI
jgi:hypothetical protein